MTARNMFNEFSARDTSDKIQSVFFNKGMAGKHLTTKSIYGYLKDPADKDKWIVDEEAADVIRRIFQMAIDGMSTYEIQ